LPPAPAHGDWFSSFQDAGDRLGIGIGRIGYAPIDYFIWLRMPCACQLLNPTNMSVKAIATALGYEDPLYFSRLFRRVNKTSPLAYRKLRKG
jgi:AraC-like DNA-binding protein